MHKGKTLRTGGMGSGGCRFQGIGLGICKVPLGELAGGWILCLSLRDAVRLDGPSQHPGSFAYSGRPSRTE